MKPFLLSKRQQQAQSECHWGKRISLWESSSVDQRRRFSNTASKSHPTPMSSPLISQKSDDAMGSLQPIEYIY